MFGKIKNKRNAKNARPKTKRHGRSKEEKMAIVDRIFSTFGGVTKDVGNVVGNLSGRAVNQQDEFDEQEIQKTGIPFIDKVSEAVDGLAGTTQNTKKESDNVKLYVGIGVVTLLAGALILKKK